MFIGILLGSFGAHRLKSYFEQYPYYADVYQKAVTYQFVHSLALILLGVLSIRWTTSLITLSGSAFCLGILLFSGSLYTLSLTKIKWLGAITPFGGLLFLAGWLLLMFASLKGT